ncbi:MAG: methyl-accepting chemotaxis protein [Firmicutes bacterium]|nr:methyl-accepting chemotaxis protein [Bacillota bacterium]
MRIRLRWKLMILLLGMIVLLFGAVGNYAAKTMYDKVIASAQEKLKSDLAMGRAYLDLRYPGPWEVRDGKLYKGDTLMNGNFAAVDAIGSLTGDTVTIFQGDTRVATNVMKEGKRAVGTKVAPEVAQAVLKEGRTYLGKANVVGTWNQTAYEPIRDRDGKIIGIWYVGVPHTVYFKMGVEFARNLLLFGLAGVLLVVLVAWFFAGYICRPIQKLAAAMEQAQEGDFTVRTNFKPQDELGFLGQQFDRMLAMLSQLLQKVVATGQDLFSSAQQLSQGAEEAAKVTEQIAATIEQVATGADNQAKSVDETSNRIKEMIKQVQQVDLNSQTVASASEQAGKAAEGGKEAITRAVTQMQTISETVNRSAQTVRNLGERSQEIGQIVSVITGIADQTNLLALNAAIEAARAGEQGRGFAVVADEVRKLAEQSAEAAKQISVLIKEIQGETEKAVQAMEAGTGEVQQGIKVVEEAGIAFSEINRAINNVAARISEVFQATREMIQSADQAAAAVENIASISQETAASAEEVAAATEEQTATMEELAASASSLHRIADQLRELTERFKLGELQESQPVSAE